jgi:hypothetical protein
MARHTTTHHVTAQHSICTNSSRSAVTHSTRDARTGPRLPWRLVKNRIWSSVAASIPRNVTALSQRTTRYLAFSYSICLCLLSDRPRAFHAWKNFRPSLSGAPRMALKPPSYSHPSRASPPRRTASNEPPLPGTYFAAPSFHLLDLASDIVVRLK